MRLFKPTRSRMHGCVPWFPVVRLCNDPLQDGVPTEIVNPSNVRTTCMLNLCVRACVHVRACVRVRACVCLCDGALVQECFVCHKQTSSGENTTAACCVAAHMKHNDMIMN